MNLSNLTTSGWVLFAVTAVTWLGLIANLVQLARKGHNDNMTASVTVTAILTVWLLWLVTP